MCPCVVTREKYILFLLLSPFQIIIYFVFSRYVFFVIHLDTHYYVYVYSKSNVCRIFFWNENSRYFGRRITKIRVLVGDINFIGCYMLVYFEK